MLVVPQDTIPLLHTTSGERRQPYFSPNTGPISSNMPPVPGHWEELFTKTFTTLSHNPGTNSSSELSSLRALTGEFTILHNFFTFLETSLGEPLITLNTCNKATSVNSLTNLFYFLTCSVQIH